MFDQVFLSANDNQISRNQYENNVGNEALVRTLLRNSIYLFNCQIKIGNERNKQGSSFFVIPLHLAFY